MLFLLLSRLVCGTPTLLGRFLACSSSVWQLIISGAAQASSSLHSFWSWASFSQLHLMVKMDWDSSGWWLFPEELRASGLEVNIQSVVQTQPKHQMKRPLSDVDAVCLLLCLATLQLIWALLLLELLPWSSWLVIISAPQLVYGEYASVWELWYV